MRCEGEVWLAPAIPPVAARRAVTIATTAVVATVRRVALRGMARRVVVTPTVRRVVLDVHAVRQRAHPASRRPHDFARMAREGPRRAGTDVTTDRDMHVNACLGLGGGDGHDGQEEQGDQEAHGALLGRKACWGKCSAFRPKGSIYSVIPAVEPGSIDYRTR